MRHRLWSLFRHLPRVIQELPYWLCYGILRIAFAIRLPRVQIGYRNSLALGRIEPFLSDLDVTVITGADKRTRAVELYAGLKRWLRALGELNVYTRGEMHGPVSSMNPLERARDPFFQNSSNDNASPATPAEKIVFIVRMLEADWAGLSERPRTRQKKWRGHFLDVGWTAPVFFDRPSVLAELLKQAGYAGTDQLVVTFVDHYRSGRSLHEFTDLSHPVVQTLFFHHVCFTQPHEKLRPNDWLVIEAQKRWETWAMHIVPNIDRDSIAHHLGNVKRFARIGVS